MNLKNILFVLFGIAALSFKGQNYNKLIIGKWHGTIMESKGGHRKNLKEQSSYEFLGNGIAIDHTFYPDKINIKYTITNDILQFGTLTFKIEIVNSNELVLLDYKASDPKGTLAFRHYFKKELLKPKPERKK